MKKDTYNAKADLKMIGDEIARQYAAGQYLRLTAEDGPNIHAPRAVFRVAGLIVRCEDSPEAVAGIVTRYRKGLPASVAPKSISAMCAAERGA